jgi:hypothetical protein
MSPALNPQPVTHRSEVGRGSCRAADYRPAAYQATIGMLRSPINSTREMIFREITIKDIPALFDVRTAVRENAFTREGLYSAGITEPAVENMLRTSHRGWLCESLLFLQTCTDGLTRRCETINES